MRVAESAQVERRAVLPRRGEPAVAEPELDDRSPPVGIRNPPNGKPRGLRRHTRFFAVQRRQRGRNAISERRELRKAISDPVSSEPDAGVDLRDGPTRGDVAKAHGDEISSRVKTSVRNEDPGAGADPKRTVGDAARWRRVLFRANGTRWTDRDHERAGETS